MGEFPSPFGPFPLWYVLGFLMILFVVGLILTNRDKLKNSRWRIDYLTKELGNQKDETIQTLLKLSAAQKRIESLSSLHSELVKVMLSENFEVVIAEHNWEEESPKPFYENEEKVVYAQRLIAFEVRNQISDERFTLEEATRKINNNEKIRILPNENIAFTLSKETESFLEDEDSFLVKVRD